MLKIIHTADIHLGAKFASFGDKSGQQRQALLDSFKKIIDTVILKKANMLLVAGDLFDSNFPSYDTVNLVKSEFKKLNDLGIFVAVLPGTHDCLGAESIYKREDFADGLENVYVFDDPNVFCKEYESLNLALYAQANTSNKSSKSPLEFLEKTDIKNSNFKYKVIMAHGSVKIEGKSAEDDWPISLSEISKSQADYIALGHWHGAQDFSFGKTKAWYCGSPEITYQEGKGGIGQGYVLEVDFLDDVEVKTVKISDKRVEELNLDLSAFSSIDSLYKEIEAKADPNLILFVNITGMADQNLIVSEEALENEFKDKFFSIRVKNSSVLRMDDINEHNYPEDMVIGQFVRIMQKKIEDAEDEQKKEILKNALKAGVAELEGKNVIK